MMAGLEVNRSVRFVSLDTHPANNALVVTYEILVVVSDSQRGHELTRRTKRDQMQIAISALDKLGEGDLKQVNSNVATLNLRQLSEEIIRKCPILTHTDESQALEDIQLHLLYLFNRRQSQLYQTAAATRERPPSAASGRLRSATGTPSAGYRSRLSSASRQNSARVRDGRRSSQSSGRCDAGSSLDVYASFCERELREGRGCAASPEAGCERRDEFVQHFEDHLMEAELAAQLPTLKLPTSQASNSPGDDLEAQLEGLYGDDREKLAAMAHIRWHARDDLRLASVQPNRLLLSAMLRTLQDSDSREPILGESILFCLMRFTQFEDVHERLFCQGDPIDLMRVVVNLLDEHIKLATKADDLRLILEKFYHLNTLLVIMNNLINLDLHVKSNRVKRRLIEQHGKQMANSLIGLFLLVARHLARDVRNQSAIKYERLTLVLWELIKLAQALSVFREFVNLLRAKSVTLVEAQINCLNILQLCRPGSGSIQSGGQANAGQQRGGGEQFFVKDQLILCEIYELEIELLKLINNLLYDSRFKLRFSRKNSLLKCVLRNLVVFLASSRRSNTLTPFDRSLVLLVPFKCLYELSCLDSIKEELFKSKIIIKCLFEYLLSSSADLKTLLDSSFAASRARQAAHANELEGRAKSTGRRSGRNMLEDDQIVLEPTHACHYILATWLNLSAKQAAPFYRSDVDKELSEPLGDYIELATLNLENFVHQLQSSLAERASFVVEDSQSFQDAQLIVYLHAKLLRNITQFVGLLRGEPLVWAGNFARWVEHLARALNQLLAALIDGRGDNQLIAALAVECVAVLANLMRRSGSFWQLASELAPVPALDWPPELASILSQLLRINLNIVGKQEGENDDDLLLVSVNLLGALAQNREICNELRRANALGAITRLCNQILETRTGDAEMLVSCLFSLSQLLNHAAYLQTLGASLADEQPEALQLADRLSALVMHGDASAAKLANGILSTLKQFEEQQSLADSIACKRRFVHYNQKWLGAIGTARGDEPTSGAASLRGDPDEAELDSALLMRANQLELRGGGGGQRALDDEFSQLRTIGQEEASSSSRMSSSSQSNRSASNQLEELTPSARRPDEDEEEVEEGEDEDEEEEEEEEETFSEPDLNVIDANSMIKHLTNRREFRSELMIKK